MLSEFEDSLDKFESENRKHFSGDFPSAGYLASIEQLYDGLIVISIFTIRHQCLAFEISVF